jgi:hypothetical protein
MPAVSHSEPGAPYATTSESCKAKLSANYGKLGKGTDIVRRLYPEFDTSTFIVKADRPFTLLYCDFAARPKPSSGVAVVLAFPSKLLIDKDLQLGNVSVVADELLRIEVAEVLASADGKVTVARNRNALPHEVISRGRDRIIPIRGARLDRTVFALNENENAVAVRFDLDNVCDGYGAMLSEYDELALFRAEGDELPLILQVTLESTESQVHCRDDDDDCGGSDTDKYILRLAKHKHGGLFDWVYKNVTHHKDGPPVSFKWNGTEYVPADSADRTHGR